MQIEIKKSGGSKPAAKQKTIKEIQDETYLKKHNVEQITLKK